MMCKERVGWIGMAADQLEDEAFRRGNRAERAFLVIRQVADLKKYCIITFLVSVILAVQVVELANRLDGASTQTVKEAVNTAWQHYGGGGGEENVNATENNV